jgi:hypothetical protein
MNKKEVLYRVLPLGVIIAGVGFVAVGSNLSIQEDQLTNPNSQAVMPEPSRIPGRGFVTKVTN